LVGEAEKDAVVAEIVNSSDEVAAVSAEAMGGAA
jgi:hypothetical protein